jgi:peptide-methionine (S)-S-oxide reductase
MSRMIKLRAVLAAAVVAAFALTQTAAAAVQTAIFAGGCFWSMQHGIEAVPGVVHVTAGYTGGHVAHPTYDQVTTETTGHYESVQVEFDPAKISYAKLVLAYFHLTDPTDATGQFCDQGPSYRPAIFVADPAQSAAANAVKAQVAAQFRGKTIATTILPAQTFWPAEGYHQDYAKKNPGAYGAYAMGCMGFAGGRVAALNAVWRH